MAIGLEEFAQLLLKAPTRKFDPQPYYESTTDSLIFYFRQEPSYSKRITKYLTVFLASQGDHLVGFEVKSLQTILKAIENLGDVDLADPVTVNFEDKEVSLHVIVRCALVPEHDEPVSGTQYEEIASKVRGVRVPLDRLCPA